MFSRCHNTTTFTSPLNQFQDICRKAIKTSFGRLHKPFNDLLVEISLLMLLLPHRVNFTQFEKYGKRSEKCYRDNFSRPFGWIKLNMELSSMRFSTGTRRAIAIDPSYISKSGVHTPGIGRFWSGCAGAVKRGLEILGIALVDADANDAMMLRAVQTPSEQSLKDGGVSLISWYLTAILNLREQLLSLSRVIVADAYFSVKPFADGLCERGFHLISRLRDNANLRYIHTGPRRAGRGRPKSYDGKIDVRHPDPDRMQRVETSFGDGVCYTLLAYAVALKRTVRLVLYYPEGGAPKIFFSTDTAITARDIVDLYRSRFQIEFCFRDAKQYTGLCDCQARDLDKLDFHFNASFCSLNVAKIYIKELNPRLSIPGVKSLLYNIYIAHRIFSLCGFRPHKSLNGQIFKELFNIAAPAA